MLAIFFNIPAPVTSWIKSWHWNNLSGIFFFSLQNSTQTVIINPCTINKNDWAVYWLGFKTFCHYNTIPAASALHICLSPMDVVCLFCHSEEQLAYCIHFPLFSKPKKELWLIFLNAVNIAAKSCCMST